MYYSPLQSITWLAGDSQREREREKGYLTACFAMLHHLTSSFKPFKYVTVQKMPQNSAS